MDRFQKETAAQGLRVLLERHGQALTDDEREAVKQVRLDLEDRVELKIGPYETFQPGDIIKYRGTEDGLIVVLDDGHHAALFHHYAEQQDAVVAGRPGAVGAVYRIDRPFTSENYEKAGPR